MGENEMKDSEIICWYCRRTFKSGRGLHIHHRTCSAKAFDGMTKEFSNIPYSELLDIPYFIPCCSYVAEYARSMGDGELGVLFDKRLYQVVVRKHRRPTRSRSWASPKYKIERTK